MGRGGESVGKRRVTAQRNDKRAAKTERRQERRQEQATGGADQAEQLMSRFHELNERRESGAITAEDFERQRHDIFVSLGLEDP